MGQLMSDDALQGLHREHGNRNAAKNKDALAALVLVDMGDGVSAEADCVGQHQTLAGGYLACEDDDGRSNGAGTLSSKPVCGGILSTRARKDQSTCKSVPPRSRMSGATIM